LIINNELFPAKLDQPGAKKMEIKSSLRSGIFIEKEIKKN